MYNISSPGIVYPEEDLLTKSKALPIQMTSSLGKAWDVIHIWQHVA